MTSSNEPPGGPAGPRGRRPPTIDLKATEVGGESAKAAPKPEDAAASPSASERLRAWLPANVASFPWPVAAAGAGGVVLTLLVLALAGVFSGRTKRQTAGTCRRSSRQRSQSARRA